MSGVGAGNPLVGTIYTADPSAHVWPGDDRLWVYPSKDKPGTDTHDTMIDYHVFSTRDLVNWVDHGQVLHLDNVHWASRNAWAPDAVFWNGLYFLVYCAIEERSGVYRTGLATSRLPQGPFEDTGFVAGVEWGQDPALFVDEDGTPYLYWGCGGGCFGARLSDDLRSVVPGTTVDLKSQLKWVFEGPWVHKYRGRYYLSYPGLPDGKWPEHMYYAVSDRPLGPFEFRGEYMGEFPKMAGTNHGSIVEFQGKWYAFYHSSWLSGGNSTCRCMMAEELRYAPDGSILPIVPTAGGVGGGRPSRCVIHLEAENGKLSGGLLRNTFVREELAGFSGTGYVDGFTKDDSAVTVLAQMARPARYRLKIRYAAAKGERNRLCLNGTEVSLPEFPPSRGFTDLDCGVLSLEAEDNEIKLAKGTGGIQVDSFLLEPEP